MPCFSKKKKKALYYRDKNWKQPRDLVIFPQHFAYQYYPTAPFCLTTTPSYLPGVALAPNAQLTLPGPSSTFPLQPAPQYQSMMYSMPTYAFGPPICR